MDLSKQRKVELLSGRSDWYLEAIPERSLPAIMMTDGPHGLRKVESESLIDIAGSAPATCFPTAAGLGATWDPALVREIGEAIGREARASGVSVVLGPGVNIKRHPRCGRNFEYYSEDPLISGVLAAAFINGVQLNGVGTSLKHFAVNNQEADRMVVDAVVDERTLREIYLPAFETAIARAHPWTVMCAYNRVNGPYCSEHHWLLTEVLRDEWGFDGLVVSDWGAVNDRVAGVKAGLDLEMPGGSGAYDPSVLAALDDGSLRTAELDACVERVIGLAERATSAVAAIPPPGPDPETGAATFDADAHHALARRAASASTVLLHNYDHVLPIDPGAHVAVIGGFAEKPRYQGAGSSGVKPTRLDSPLEELRAIARPAGGRVTYAPGYEADAGERPDLIDDAVAIARNAELAVVFAGLPPRWESEGFDRDHLRLPYQHDQLIRAVAAANPQTIVVLSNGGPVLMPWVDDVPGIVEAYLGGQAMGGGIADVLYGLAEPGGRLAETFPNRQADVPSDAWFPGSGRQVQYREGLYVGYRWFESADADVLFPFGHGLSYTTFEVGEPALSAAAIDAGDQTTVTVDVTNTGGRAGSEVLQVYVRPVSSPIARPERELRDFAKVHLQPGERARVQCTLGPRAFSHWDVDTGAWQIVDGEYEILVGTSSRDIRGVLPLKIRSDFAPATNPDDPYRNPFPDGWTVSDEAFTALLRHPIPEPDPIRPFHRNSTLGDLGDSPAGRPLLTVARAIAARATAKMDSEGGIAVMVDRVLQEAPLRSLSTMSKGRFSLKALDRSIRALNAVSGRSGRRRRPPRG
ncbi:MAG TPA: glycoside hydrolase family 3 C-terminal domain-containing protein [Acidimicrobiales bacterium]|nr:glycoside hydrolase family 3 C-terminal domain-containing protein [Acidimicrobiales bacterium]